MTPKEELLQFIASHGDDPRVVAGLLDMAKRTAAGESMESIANRVLRGGHDISENDVERRF